MQQTALYQVAAQLNYQRLNCSASLSSTCFICVTKNSEQKADFQIASLFNKPFEGYMFDSLKGQRPVVFLPWSYSLEHCLQRWKGKRLRSSHILAEGGMGPPRRAC